jgi:hypothetical protein
MVISKRGVRVSSLMYIFYIKLYMPWEIQPEVGFPGPPILGAIDGSLLTLGLDGPPENFPTLRSPNTPPPCPCTSILLKESTFQARFIR